MATKNSILNKENLRSRIERIMLQYQLKSKDVNHEGLKITVYDRGQYDCESCGHMWQSNFSWIRLNLKDQEIDYRYKMKCKHCLIPFEPTFSMEQIEVMIEKAVCIYKKVPYETERKRIGRGKFTPPHMPVLCEKCGWGTTLCWLRRSH